MQFHTSLNHHTQAPATHPSVYIPGAPDLPPGFSTNLLWEMAYNKLTNPTHDLVKKVEDGNIPAAIVKAEDNLRHHIKARDRPDLPVKATGSKEPLYPASKDVRAEDRKGSKGSLGAGSSAEGLGGKRKGSAGDVGSREASRGGASRVGKEPELKKDDRGRDDHHHLKKDDLGRDALHNHAKKDDRGRDDRQHQPQRDSHDRDLSSRYRDDRKDSRHSPREDITQQQRERESPQKFDRGGDSSSRQDANTASGGLEASTKTEGRMNGSGLTAGDQGREPSTKQHGRDDSPQRGRDPPVKPSNPSETYHGRDSSMKPSNAPDIHRGREASLKPEQRPHNPDGHGSDPRIREPSSKSVDRDSNQEQRGREGSVKSDNRTRALPTTTRDGPDRLREMSGKRMDEPGRLDTAGPPKKHQQDRYMGESEKLTTDAKKSLRGQSANSSSTGRDGRTHSSPSSARSPQNDKRTQQQPKSQQGSRPSSSLQMRSSASARPAPYPDSGKFGGGGSGGSGGKGEEAYRRREGGNGYKGGTREDDRSSASDRKSVESRRFSETSDRRNEDNRYNEGSRGRREDASFYNGSSGRSGDASSHNFKNGHPRPSVSTSNRNNSDHFYSNPTRNPSQAQRPPSSSSTTSSTTPQSRRVQSYAEEIERRKKAAIDRGMREIENAKRRGDLAWDRDRFGLLGTSDGTSRGETVDRLDREAKVAAIGYGRVHAGWPAIESTKNFRVDGDCEDRGRGRGTLRFSKE
ncbi:hypothetical protein HDU67_001676 [Dinochytrium kinnereticum]|nr:hypothetical protein HDU67_001676 [Dinochytrium kinnereticum]